MYDRNPIITYLSNTIYFYLCQNTNCKTDFVIWFKVNFTLSFQLGVRFKDNINVYSKVNR